VLDVSIIVPVCNEEENLPELCCRLRIVLEETMGVSYEIILIDDGSTDRSWHLIRQLSSDNHSVKGIRLSRNFGHHVAITAGLDYAEGKAIVLMDADLQDPPEEIPKLYLKLKEGYDVAYAIREMRSDSVTKIFWSQCFHFVFNWLTKLDIDPGSGIFRVISRRVASAVRRCNERSRLIIGLVSWTGFSQIGVVTRRDPRKAGRSKYTFCESVRLAADAITAFSFQPLRLAIYSGGAMGFLSLVGAAYVLGRKVFLGIAVPGYASLMVSLLFIGSVQLFVLGIIGEYMGRIYAETQQRPLYILRAAVGIAGEELSAVGSDR